MGKLIVIEGIDGSGKSTQFNLLCDKLASESRGFMRVRFPRYDKPSAALLTMYLNGEFGEDPDAVNAYAASSFYAVDRFASFVQDWREYYERGGLVLTDRYTTSNALHQGAKLPENQRAEFFGWLYEYEFKLLGLPEPGIVIFLDIEADVALERLRRRQDEMGTAGDIHEKDKYYLDACAQSGKQASSIYGWHRISCCREGIELNESELHREIYGIVADYAFEPE